MTAVGEPVPLLALDDSPLFHWVIQCPVVVSAGASGLRLLVSSRDADNSARVHSVRLVWQGNGGWTCDDVQEFVLPADIHPTCVGVMPGHIVRSGRDDPAAVLLGTSYAFTPTFHGSLFALPIRIDEHAITVAGPPARLFDDVRDRARFRTTPARLETPQGPVLVYAASEPYRAAADGDPGDSGYPSAYGLHWCTFNDRSCGPEHAWIWPDLHSSAVTFPSPGPGRNEVWFCVRGGRQWPGDRYGLARASFSGSIADTTVDWDPVSGVCVQEGGGLAYPAIVDIPGGPCGVIACGGNWGSGGLLWIDIPAPR